MKYSAPGVWIGEWVPSLERSGRGREAGLYQAKSYFMHWIAPSEKGAGSGTLEKRLWAAAEGRPPSRRAVA
jgi:hypothetical protein